MADSLGTWTVATANFVCVALLVTLVGHGSGLFAGTLAGVESFVAVVLFGYGWLLTLVATFGLRSELEPAVDRRPARIVGYGAGAGALVGLLFVTVVLVVAFTATGGDRAVLEPGAVPVIVAVATGGGALAGVLVTLADLACYAAAGRLVRFDGS